MADTYTTKQGDMWDSIAKKCYGTEDGINALMEANDSYVNIVVFPAGVTLTLPEYTKPVTTVLPPWRK